MKEKFRKKCKRIFQQEKEVKISDSSIKRLKTILGEAYSTEYEYIINYYAYVFLKDKFEIFSKTHSPMADDNGTEPFLYFLGTEGDENVFSIFEQYKEQILGEYVPIALADGGNLICLGVPSGKVFLWIHDDVNGPFEIFNSIEEMILMVKEEDKEEDSSGVKKMIMSDEFLDAVEAFKKGSL